MLVALINAVKVESVPLNFNFLACFRLGPLDPGAHAPPHAVKSKSLTSANSR